MWLQSHASLLFNKKYYIKKNRKKNVSVQAHHNNIVTIIKILELVKKTW